MHSAPPPRGERSPQKLSVRIFSANGLTERAYAKGVGIGPRGIERTRREQIGRLVITGMGASFPWIHRIYHCSPRVTLADSGYLFALTADAPASMRLHDAASA